MATILHTESSQGWGGQEMRIVAEARGVAAHGHRVVIAAPGNATILERASAAGLPTVAVPMKRNIDLRDLMRLLAIVRRERVDIINTHSSIDAWLGGFAAKLSRTPLLRTRHVSIPIKKHAFNFVHRWPAITMTTGERVRENFIAETGASADRVVSVPTGVDVDSFSPSDDRFTLRRQLQLPDSARIVATIGVLRRAKRHLVLLASAARLRRRNEVYFVFAGEGSQRQPIEAEVQRLGLVGRVFLLGHVEDVRPVLAGADVVASASSGMEGVPQALAQALSMERPVVATDDGAVGELIRDRDTGLLVPCEQPDSLATAIERMLDDAELASGCGRRGRDRVIARYSSAAMIAAVEDIYRRLMPDA